MAMKPITCKDYRQEMILVGLKRRLTDARLSPEEKKRLEDEIRRLEMEMGMA